jgi:hypothetical protein
MASTVPPAMRAPLLGVTATGTTEGRGGSAATESSGAIPGAISGPDAASGSSDSAGSAIEGVGAMEGGSVGESWLSAGSSTTLGAGAGPDVSLGVGGGTLGGVAGLGGGATEQAAREMNEKRRRRAGVRNKPILETSVIGWQHIPRRQSAL